jgi:hypothetical protein
MDRVWGGLSRPFPYKIGRERKGKMNIGGREYELKYSVEASLYDECVEKTTSIMVKFEEASESTDDKEAIRETLKAISNIAQTTISMFYAGLLEKHGTGRHGDGSVKSIEDAKDLIRDYFEENEDANYWDMMTMMLDQMGKDGFFKRIGLERMTEQASTQNRNVPQDHKKKSKGGVK